MQPEDSFVVASAGMMRFFWWFLMPPHWLLEARLQLRAEESTDRRSGCGRVSGITEKGARRKGRSLEVAGTGWWRTLVGHCRSADWLRRLLVREKGSGIQALLGEQIMKRRSTSGSLLSLSQWLHTHSSSAHSPCCPLSAGPASPSLTTTTISRDSPMTKCLWSWTEGKSILGAAVDCGGVQGRQREREIEGRRSEGEGCRGMHTGMLGMLMWFVFFKGGVVGVYLSLLCHPFPPHAAHLGGGGAAPLIVNSSSAAVSERAKLQGFVCLSTGDRIRRCSSITDCCLYSSAGQARRC